MAHKASKMASGKQAVIPTGKERFFQEDEVIVSKTDLKGRLTYVNKIFMSISDYREQELLGQPHNMIRHPDMPRSVFKILWDNIVSGREIFAYVINMGKNGDHYWVLAHVTPSFDRDGKIVGYHSNRRVPNRNTLTSTIMPLYQRILSEENRYQNAKDGMKKGFDMFQDIIREKGTEYDRLIFSLQSQTS